MKTKITKKPLLVFDGVCVLCSRLLRFVLWADQKTKKLSFATAQSQTGQQALQQCGQKTDNVETVLLIFPDGSFYTKMDVVIEVCRILGGVWRLFDILKIFPRSARNNLYDFIARRRYQWFGKGEYCLAIPQKYRDRIIQ